MRNRKMELKFFTVPEWKKEQEYLRKQHKKGWKFTKVNFVCYHFEKCEPEDVVYQTDYNPEGRAHKEEYVQMFRDCGWEYLQDSFGFSYFRKSASETNPNEEIFCDDASRIEMMKRVFKGRMIPLLSIFFLIILPQISMQSRGDMMFHHIMAGFYIVMFVLYIVAFIMFGVQFWKLTNKKLE
ncbi:MAG: DUF2812 domain-containing protein [Lachnospiraceae bacterium]|nr:DUF2812 domain-containing protein [Lachnospiraceae bacterium]